MYLRKQYPSQFCYVYILKRHLALHNGLEINKWFDVELKNNVYSNIVASFLYWGSRILRKLSFPVKFVSTDEDPNELAILHEGYWQDKKYIDFQGIKYKKIVLSHQNHSILDRIKSCESIAIHVRKGDYVLYPEIFGGICTREYYYNSIKYVKSKIRNCVFFVFSDDIDYAKELLENEKIIIVDWNRGKDSFFDMFLMSHCRYMILANSTFSYWAAILNKEVEEVICPPKWTNINSPDIIQERWTIMNS